ncbi:ABC transporter substrate-binding protein [Bacillus sp. FJAT-45037]|uniref:ABC transporter substrate-binding protein n=1 Tax=Bacillus sp. FJAT-45037 TaxID=2011007 RepID=UPI000C243764|nr:ABC transporter substrate-binding protein [Bacillus sp. FJAT-45037]
MKFFKRMAMGTFAVSMSVMLAACGGNEPTSDTPADPETDTDSGEEAAVDDDEVVTITYARGFDATEGNTKLVEAFMEQNPNIKVEFQEMPADTGAQHDSYVTAFSAQSAEIDVFDVDVIWPAEFAQANYALELDRFIDQDGIDMDAYFPGTVQSGNVGGKQFAMPKFTDAGLLYYRSDIIDTPPATWDELIEMASAHQGEEGTQFGYLMQANQYEGLVVNATEFIAAYGGEVINENGEVVINSPEAIKGIEKMAEIATSDFVPGDILSFMETETANSFIQGNAVFARNWPYMQSMANDEANSDVAGNVDFALLPAGDAGSAAGLGGWMTMISRYSENIEASWELVKFMTGPEGQKITAMYGGNAPTIEALYEDAEVQEVSPLFANEEFVSTLQNAVPRPITPIYPEISDIMQIELSSVLAGSITAEEAVANMEEKMNAAINN